MQFTLFSPPADTISFPDEHDASAVLSILSEMKTSIRIRHIRLLVLNAIHHPALCRIALLCQRKGTKFTYEVVGGEDAMSVEISSCLPLGRRSNIQRTPRLEYTRQLITRAVGATRIQRITVPSESDVLHHVHAGQALHGIGREGEIVQIGAAARTLPKTADGSREALRAGEMPEQFVAAVAFRNDGSYLPGMGGRAKIFLGRRSFLSRTWRVLRHWAQTVVWW